MSISLLADQLRLAIENPSLNIADLPGDEEFRGLVACLNALLEDRRNRQAEAADRELRARATLESASDAIISISRFGSITSFNAAAERMFGFSRYEVLGKNVHVLIPTSQRARHDEHLAAFVREGHSPIFGMQRRITAHRRDGQPFFASLHVSAPSFGVMTAVIADITEQVHAERRLAVQYDVTRILSEASREEEAWPAVLESLGRGLGYCGAVLWIVDGPRRLLRRGECWCQCGAAIPVTDGSSEHTCMAGEGLAGRAWAEERPQIAEFAGGPQANKCGEHPEGTCALPLRSRGLVYAILEFFGGDRHQSPEQLEQLADSIDRQFNTFRAHSKALQAVREHAAELEAANGQLRLLSEKAREANEAKSRFLANMSHEIRTPMTAILGFAEQLNEPTTKAEDCAEYANIILRQGKHLLDLINDILDFSKIEAGKVCVENIECSLPQILDDVAAAVRGRARAKGLALVVELDPAVPLSILSDPTRLKQILFNLAGNAVKFTHAGSVRIVAERRPSETEADSRLAIHVIDTGIGITSEQLAQIFEPFAQADVSTTRQYGGTGLGLSICRPLARMLGGELLVESHPGQGSRFTLVLGIQTPSTAKAAAGQPAEQSFRSTRTGPRTGRILLAEDAVDNQRLVSMILRKAGWEVTVAENGEIACELALQADESRAFDLILMDMQMPVLDGYAATSRLRSHDYAGSIIALTANALSGDRERCLAAGCDGFAPKPIVRAELLAVVDQFAGEPTEVPKT